MDLELVLQLLRLLCKVERARVNLIPEAEEKLEMRQIANDCEDIMMGKKIAKDLERDV